jgi:hypothetical protein
MTKKRSETLMGNQDRNDLQGIMVYYSLIILRIFRKSLIAS